MSPSSSRQRTFTLLLGSGLLLGLALWSAYWLFALDKAGDRLAAWRETLQQSGTGIDCKKERWSGFPFRIALACTPLSITLSSAPQPITIGLSRIDLLAQAYDLHHVIAVAASPVAVNGLAFQYRQAVASFDDSGAAGKNSVRIIAAVEGLAGNAPFLRDHPLDAFSLEGVLSTDPPLLIIDRLDLRAAEIGVNGSGGVALDEDRRLAGRLKLSVARFDLLLAEITRSGLLSQKDTAGASLLALLGSKNRRVTIELKLDRGRVYLGPFKVGEMPPLW
jgi:hypothetical protein